MRFNDAVIGAAVVVFGLAVIFHVRTYPDMGGRMMGPALFPTVLALLMIVAGLVQIRAGIKSKEPPVRRLPEFTLSGAVKFLLAAGCVVFYIYASDYLGFLITSFAVMFVLMLALRARPLLAVLVAAGATVCVYLVFNKMLLVPLPIGLFSF
ncbi:MAG: tripartite tricarboxylate transporter TctB family protein [Synergistaceae bacterium]|jgi:putative tricarboxylic transport membrane protein|nr:tripartite tricarboxylate transporter TctB family protein [Synergistaceae bacterium]